MNSDFESILMEIPKIGNNMHELMVELFPICRSITGNGVRQSLQILQNHISLNISEIPSGTEVFDWTIPREWNINDAYIKNSKGEKIVDFKKSNLHVLNYSIPICTKLSLQELLPHLHSLPNQPNVIPYRTSYYKENWGFCITHNQLINLQDDEYEVVIDSTLENGSLTYAEFFIQGESDDEVLFSCYTCHPSMCNDNLSGVVLFTFLAKHLKNLSLKYSYRFLFIPETIGAITWLSQNESNLKKIKHGLVAYCVGDPGNSSYKKSRQGNAEIDQIVMEVLKNTGDKHKVVDFFPTGSDERQFCSPGFNLPVGALVRTFAPEFSEYHTSADNTEFVKAEYLGDTLSKYIKVIVKLEENFGKFKLNDEEKLSKNIHGENDRIFLNLNPKCEPQLGKRKLYHDIGSQIPSQGGGKIINQFALLWVLNYSDGLHYLSDIVKLSGYDLIDIENAANELVKSHLLKEL
jgi:aminopeptidase-like protein